MGLWGRCKTLVPIKQFETVPTIRTCWTDRLGTWSQRSVQAYSQEKLVQKVNFSPETLSMWRRRLEFTVSPLSLSPWLLLMKTFQDKELLFQSTTCCKCKYLTLAGFFLPVIPGWVWHPLVSSLLCHFLSTTFSSIHTIVFSFLCGLGTLVKDYLTIYTGFISGLFCSIVLYEYLYASSTPF